MKTSRTIVVASVLLVAVAGCEPGDQVKTLEELAREYNAAVARGNSGSTVVGTILPAHAKLSPERSGLSSPVSFVMQEDGMLLVRPLPAPTAEELAEAAAQLNADQAALELIRGARGLPAGLVPMDLLLVYRGQQVPPYASACRALALRLRAASNLSSYQGKKTEALAFARDALEIEQTLHEAPMMLLQLTNAAVQDLSGATFLSIGLAAQWSPEELRSMASDLSSAQMDIPAVMQRTLEVRRAWVLDVFQRIARSDEETIAAVLSSSLPSLEGTQQPKDPATFGKAKEALLAQLRDDQRTTLLLYDSYEDALESHPKRLNARPPEPLGTVGKKLGPQHVYPLAYDRLLDCQVRRRAVVLILKALAFRSEKGRMPRAEELDLQEDPFRPGEDLVYEYDERSDVLSVYSRRWKKGPKAEAAGQRTGYTLSLKPKKE